MEKVSSVYIHIPFCTSICSYCDFPKVLCNKRWIDDYLLVLEKEIKEKYKDEKIKTIYIGGGTPSSLSILQLQKLFEITKIFNVDKNAEITMEANSNDLSEEKLKFLKNKITRLSIGIESFNEKITNELGREKANYGNVALVTNYFDNVNVDLMYDVKNQTFDDIKKDIEICDKLNIKHISLYSLIIEKNTKFYIDNYQKEDNFYEEDIEKLLKEKGYIHYEISNYAKEGHFSIHNLTYWNNEGYYGFGMGASGYIDNIRYDNTKNLTRYLNGKYVYEKYKVDLNEKLQNEFILGFRKIKGINKKQFFNKYNFDIKNINIIKKLLKEEKLLENDNIYINPKYIYYSNDILCEFLINLKE